jgi:hypothetical protein
MRSLIAPSRATCPTLFHLSSLGKQCSLACERNYEGRVKLYPVHAMKAGARYCSFLPEHLAQEKNLLPLTGFEPRIVQSHTLPLLPEKLPKETRERERESERERCGKVWGIFCVSHNLCNYWRQFAPKKCAYCHQNWISQQGGLPFRVQALNPGCMKPASWVAVVTTFSTTARSIWGSSRLNLFHANLLAPRILR